mmetsp:Transcript_42466/g.140729  ORF Transcript_42466/g.140729 Transcript_42466/m.140729 type:complete len:216 (-) Transcript_42466:334-981(-)
MANIPGTYAFAALRYTASARGQYVRLRGQGERAQGAPSQGCGRLGMLGCGRSITTGCTFARACCDAALLAAGAWSGFASAAGAACAVLGGWRDVSGLAGSDAAALGVVCTGVICGCAPVGFACVDVASVGATDFACNGFGATGFACNGFGATGCACTGFGSDTFGCCGSGGFGSAGFGADPLGGTGVTFAVTFGAVACTSSRPEVHPLGSPTGRL